VVFRDGASPTQRGEAAGARKSDAFGRCPPSKLNPNPNQAQSARRQAARSGRDNPAPGCHIVRVERDRGSREWLVIHGENAWPCSSRNVALKEAAALAAQYGFAMVAEGEA
jgi:hypothetical protein